MKASVCMVSKCLVTLALKKRNFQAKSFDVFAPLFHFVFVLTIEHVALFIYWPLFMCRCRYRMVFHPWDNNNRVNPYRFTLLVGAAQRQNQDGLTSLKYQIVKKTKNPLYTNITADVGKPPLKPNVSSFGTGVDIVVSLSLLLLLFSFTCCTCFKSRLLHLFLCPKRVRWASVNPQFRNSIFAQSWSRSLCGSQWKLLLRSGSLHLHIWFINESKKMKIFL